MDEYEKRAKERHYQTIDVAYSLYDSLWVLALALNGTVAMTRNGDVSVSGCQDHTGPLVPLEQFNYTNEMIGCLIRWHIGKTNFSGLTVSFNTYILV